MIQPPPCEVLGYSRGRHDTIYPRWFFLWLVVFNVASVCIYNEHFTEHVAGITTRWLHERDCPVWVEAVIKFKGGIEKSAIGIAAQVNMAQKVLVQQRSWQVGNRGTLTRA